MDEQTKKTIKEDELIARTRLRLAPGIGPKYYHILMSQYGSAIKVLQAPRCLLLNILSGDTLEQLFLPEAEGDAREEIRKTRKLGAKILPFGHPEYPKRLLDIPKPPPMLWIAGNIPLLRGVAIVGKRAASMTNRSLTKEISKGLCKEGIVIISGGAYGIDAAAHEGCLEGEGETICVLGSSLNRPYPERNIGLFKKIANGNGAVMSHLQLSVEPHKGCFLQRNRIIAALSVGVCVIEAGLRSGARNTAAHARKLGIPVMAVPGSPGTIRLLSEGAFRVECAQDILNVIDGKKEFSGMKMPQDIPEEGKKILEASSVINGRTPSELSSICGISLSETLSLLTELEIEGLVIRLPGNRYSSPCRSPAQPKNKFGG